MPKRSGLRSLQRKALTEKVDPIHNLQDLWTLTLIRDIADGKGIVGNWPEIYKESDPRSMFVTWATLNGPPPFYADSIKRLHKAGKIKRNEAFCKEDPASEMPDWLVYSIDYFPNCDLVSEFAIDWGLDYDYGPYDEGITGLPYVYDKNSNIEESWGYWSPTKRDVTDRPTFFVMSEAWPDGVCGCMQVPCPSCGSPQDLPLVGNGESSIDYRWICANDECLFFSSPGRHWGSPLVVKVGRGRNSYRVSFSVEYYHYVGAQDAQKSAENSA